MPYLFLRSNELRGGRWDEINFDKQEWIIPAVRMKRRREHFVPLPQQVMALLRELKDLTKNDELIFPSPFSATRCITDVCLLNSLRRMGYGRDEMCVHGFRTIASTLMEGLGVNENAKEMQLSHTIGTQVSGAYNKYTYETERREMMQRYADYLDALREKALDG